MIKSKLLFFSNQEKGCIVEKSGVNIRLEFCFVSPSQGGSKNQSPNDGVWHDHGWLPASGGQGQLLPDGHLEPGCYPVWHRLPHWGDRKTGPGSVMALLTTGVYEDSYSLSLWHSRTISVKLLKQLRPFHWENIIISWRILLKPYLSLL